MRQGTVCLLSGTLYFPCSIPSKTQPLVSWLLPEQDQKTGFWPQIVWTLMCHPVQRHTSCSLEGMRLLFKFISLDILSQLGLLALPPAQALGEPRFPSSDAQTCRASHGRRGQHTTSAQRGSSALVETLSALSWHPSARKWVWTHRTSAMHPWLLSPAGLEEKKVYRETLLRVTGTLWFPSAGGDSDDIYRKGNYI